MSSMILTPYLSVVDAKKAVDFYQRAFGAIETGPRLIDPDGNIIHTELTLGTSILMLADESNDFENWSPVKLGGTPVRLSLEVENVNTVFKNAISAGARVLIEVSDQFYGHRAGRLEDPFGHIWIVSQEIEKLDQHEMQKRADALYSGNS